MIVFCFVLVSTFLSVSDTSSINNNPGSVSIHENYDGTHNLWSVSATCYVRYTYSYYVSSRRTTACDWLDWGWQTCSYYVQTIRYAHAYTNVACNQFYINSDPSGNFQMSGSTVQKKTCTSTYCGPSCNADGCLNNGESHTVGVTAYRTGYETNGAVSGSFTVNVYKANDPSFYYSAGNSISVSHDTAGIGTVINTIVPSYLDDGNDYDYIRYRQDSGPETSYIHGTSDLFYLDTSNGQVKVMKDLTNEFSYYFKMRLCVYDRRHYEYCLDLDITLWACFQTPTCTEQSDYDIPDTYGTYTGHSGSSNTIFNMQYPQPTGHFLAFSSVWHDLTWTFDLNEFPEATINSDTGEIYITRNISIWPSWPTKDYNMVVRVANSESCYTTTCSFKVRIHYTNWPIEIRSLPTSYFLHEDYDWEIRIHSLITYDYNYYWEDNVTCQIIAWSPNEANLFELRHDGNHAYNSYSLYKLRCQTPNCGYKYQSPIPYYCDTDIGCLTHSRRQQYTVTIQCWDAYDSTDIEVLTMNVVKNAAPAFSNLPAHIDLNRQTVSYLDNIFEIMYSDSEHENLNYEYTYQEAKTKVDPNYFLGSTWGNYYNQLGSITMTTSLRDKEANKTYRIHICGHERRNEICDDLTIDVEEYCSATPQCNNATFSTNTEFAVGDELFDISSLVHGGTFNDLNYSIESDPSSLFTVDSSSGSVTLAEEFDEIFDSSTYSIVAYVHNDGACDHAECQLTVVVTAVNYPVEITNLPASVSISEDTNTTLSLFTIATSDDNPADTFTCEIVNTNSMEPFYLDRIPPVSGDYVILNREDGGLSSATTTYSVSIECTDSHGGSDTDVLTITVLLNQAPTFTSFSTAGTNNISADPMDLKVGDTLHTVAASDHEGDELTFTCTIANTQVPYECETGATSVKLKINRELNLVDDGGQVYSVQICVKDAKHAGQCGDLDVSFIQYCSATPQCNNATISTDTEFAVGEELFDISSLVHGGTFNNLNYSIESDPSSLFTVDSSTGSVTLADEFDEIFDSATYSIVAYVHNDGACDHAECQLTVNVTSVNYPVEITNLPASVSISEDTNTTQTLFTIATFDDNPADTFTCEIVNTNSVEPFYLDRIPPVSGDYVILNREDGGLSSATTTYSVSIECTDRHGGSDTDVLTITILLNQAPTFTSFSTAGTNNISADPMDYKVGDILHTVAASDHEGDKLTFTCTIANSQVPYECETGAISVKLKINRELSVVDDGGQVYSVQICVKDAKHTDQCGDLDVSFTRYSENYTTEIPENLTTGHLENYTTGSPEHNTTLSTMNYTTGHPDSYTTGSPEHYTTRSPSNYTTRSHVSNTTGRSENYTTENSEKATTGHPENFTKGNHSYYTTGHPENYTTGSPEKITTGNRDNNNTGSLDYYTTGHPENYTSGSPESFSTGHPDNYTSGSPEHYTTGSPEHYDTGNTMNYTTVSPNNDNTGHSVNYTTDHYNIGSTGYNTTGHPKNFTTGHPGNYTSGSPDNFTKSSPENNTTRTPLSYTNGSSINYTTESQENSTTRNPASYTTGHSKAITTRILQNYTTESPEKLTTGLSVNYTSGSPKNLTTGHPEYFTTGNPGNYTSGHHENTITGGPENYTTESPERFTTGHPEYYTTVSPESFSTGHLNNYTTGNSEHYTTGSPENFTTGHPDNYTLGSPEHYTTRSPVSNTTKSSENYTTENPENYTSEHHENTITGSPEKDTTGSPDSFTTGHPDILTTGHQNNYTTKMPEHYTTGSHENYTTGHPENYTTGTSENYTTGYPVNATIGHPENLTTGHQEKYTLGHTENFTLEHPESYTTGRPANFTTGDPTSHTTESPENFTTGNPDKNTSGSPEHYTTRSPMSYTTRSSENYTTGNPENFTIGQPGNYTSGHPENTITGSPENFTIGSPESFTTGHLDNFTSGSPEHYTTGSPKNNTIGHPGNYTSGHPENTITGSPEKYTTESPESFATGHPDNFTSGSPEHYTTGSPKNNTIGHPGYYTSGHPENTITGSPENYTTGSPESFATGHPDNFTSGSPEHYTTGSPENYTIGTSENYTTGYPVNATIGHSKNLTTGHQENYTLGHTENFTLEHPENYTTGRPANYTTGDPVSHTTESHENFTTGHPDNYTSGSPEHYTTRSPMSYTTRSSENYTTGNPENFTIGQPGNYTSGHPENTITGSPENFTTGSPESFTTGHPNNFTSGSPEDYTTRSPENYTIGHPGNYTSGHPENTITESPENFTTGSPESFTTGHPDNFTSGSPEHYTTRSPENYTIGHPGNYTSGHPENTITGSPENYTTGSPESSTTGHLDNFTSGSPEHYTTGSSENFTIGHPGNYTTGSPENDTIESPDNKSTRNPEDYTTVLPENSTTGYPENFSTEHPNNFTTVSPENYTAVSPENYTSGSPKNYTSESPDKYTTGNPENYTSGPPENYTTGIPKNFTIGSPENSTTGQLEYYSTGNPENLTKGDPDNYTTGNPQNYTSGYPVNYTTRNPQNYTTRSPVSYTTRISENYTTTNPDNSTTGHPVNLTTGHPNNYTTGIPEHYTTGSPENYTTGHFENYTTGNPENYTTGNPENYTTGTSENFTTGYSVNASTGHPDNLLTRHPNNYTLGHPESYTTGSPEKYTTINSENYTTGSPENDTTEYPGNSTSGYHDDDKSTKCTFCTSTGKALLAVLIVGCVVISLLIVYAVYKCWLLKSNILRKRRPDTITPSRPRFNLQSALGKSIIPSGHPKTSVTSSGKEIARANQTSNNGSKQGNSSSESSSSSSDRVRPLQIRPKTGHSRFQPPQASNPREMAETPGLPPPMHVFTSGSVKPSSAGVLTVVDID